MLMSSWCKWFYNGRQFWNIYLPISHLATPGQSTWSVWSGRVESDDGPQSTIKESDGDPQRLSLRSSYFHLATVPRCCCACCACCAWQIPVSCSTREHRQRSKSMSHCSPSPVLRSRENNGEGCGHVRYRATTLSCSHWTENMIGHSDLHFLFHRMPAKNIIQGDSTDTRKCFSQVFSINLDPK